MQTVSARPDLIDYTSQQLADIETESKKVAYILEGCARNGWIPEGTSTYLFWRAVPVVRGDTFGPYKRIVWQDASGTVLAETVL